MYNILLTQKDSQIHYILYIIWKEICKEDVNFYYTAIHFKCNKLFMSY